MFIKDGMVYAENPEPLVRIVSARALDDYKLWVRFESGETKEVDFKPLLKKTAFKPLNDIEVFKNVYVDYGAPVWNDGEIDIAPEYLLNN